MSGSYAIVSASQGKYGDPIRSFTRTDNAVTNRIKFMDRDFVCFPPPPLSSSVLISGTAVMTEAVVIAVSNTGTVT